MANTVVGFSISIDGIQNINELNAAIAQTQKEINATNDAAKKLELQEKLGKLKAEQAGIKKNQDDINKSFLEGVKSLGAYDRASAKLNRLRKDFKNLAVEGKGATAEAKALQKEIQQLDEQLKKADANVGQFQRNVGNYPKVFNLAGRGLRRYAGVLEDTEGKLGTFQIALIGAFAAFKAGAAIVKVIGDINQFNKELERTEQQLKALTGVSGEELEGLQTNITALAKTFDVDSKTIIDSAKQISDKTGVSFQEAIGQIENGLLKGNESSEAFLSGIAEYPEAYAKVTKASGEFANKQTELLESNRALAESQAEGAKRFEETGRKLELLGNNIKAYLIDYLIFAYENAFKPLYERAILPLIGAFDNLIKSFGGGGNALEFLGKMAYYAFIPLEKLLQLFTLIINGLSSVITYARQAGEAIGLINKAEAEKSQQAINNIKKQQDAEAKAQQEREKIEAQKAKAEQDEIERRKKQQEAIKQANEEAKRQQEQLAKDRKKFLDEENKFTEAALKVNQSIIEKANKLTTELIANEYVKRRQVAKENYDQELQQAQESINEQNKLNTERLKEAEKLFGAESEQAKKLRAEIDANQKASSEELSIFESKLRLKLNDELLAIDKDQTDKLIEENKKLYDKRKSNIENAYKNEITILDTLLAQGLITEQDYNNQVYELTKKRLEDELALNKKQLDTNKDLNQDEINSIVSQNLSLNEQLAKLDSDRTKKAIEENKKREDDAKERSQKQRERLAKDIQDAADYTKLALDTLGGFLDASEQKRMERFAKEEEMNQAAIENLNNRLQRATGLERRYLEQQLQAEQQNAERIAKEKEKAEKQAKKQKKALAIIDSIINTALAISAANTLVPPANIPAMIYAGIAGAAQTAVIAAQPLAKGGVVGKGDEIVQFANGGKVTSKGNIKPLSNGDNVLATLKTGEIVLNEAQQRRIGFSTLKKAQIPNFANGGMVGAPSTLIANANNSIATEQMRVNMIEEMISATNNRMDRLSVVYTATTDYEVEKSRNDKKTIKVNSTF